MYPLPSKGNEVRRRETMGFFSSGDAMRNVENILRHELIGLQCSVVKAANKSQVGISGRIEDETLKTIVINGKRVFKKDAVFRLKVGSSTVEVDGNYLLTRPEDRIKKKIKKW
jgi:ribonuclease P protein subunit POP4